MPQLKLEFDEYKRPKNAAAKFLAQFNTFFREYGKAETRTDVIVVEGHEMTRQDAYWLEVTKQIEVLLRICKGTDFEDFGKAMVYSFVDSIEKASSRYEKMRKARQREIEKEQRREEMKRREEQKKQEGSKDEASAN
jgi:spore cortex formation protein SpoVR/YcgB (stage V sporulation)